MQLKTLEWARGLCVSLRIEIENSIVQGVSDSRSLDRIVGLRTQLKQAETLVSALQEQFPGQVDPHALAEASDA